MTDARREPVSEDIITELVNKFLAWPLPDSVCSDLCATKQGYPHRSGTTLLSAIEARQMIEYLYRALADRLATEETERAEAVRRYEASEVRANDLQQRLAASEHKTLDLIRRNRILRTRVDLPMTHEEKAKYKELEQRLAASEKEVREIQALLGCHRAYIPESIRDLQAKTEDIPNIDRVRQAEQRLAEVERARDEAYGYLSRLFTSWHPECVPLLTLGGICTQIDNACCGDKQRLADAQATISRLEDRIDLQCDEFQRISALTENDEVKGLCARAVKDIRQHIPVIQQRDTAEQQVARLRVFAEFIKDKRRKQWARWADEAEDPVSTDDEIEKLDEQFREACKALRETGA